MANVLFFTTCIIRFWRLPLGRIVLKLKLQQLLTCIYSKFRLLKRIQCCCNVLPYLSSLGAPHSHIMFQSPLENSCLYSQLKPTWEIVKFWYEKNESTFILLYNLESTNKHRPSRERTSSNLTGSEDSRGKLTCLSDWLFRHHSGFQANRTWKLIQDSRRRIRQSGFC